MTERDIDIIEWKARHDEEFVPSGLDLSSVSSEEIGFSTRIMSGRYNLRFLHDVKKIRVLSDKSIIKMMLMLSNAAAMRGADPKALCDSYMQLVNKSYVGMKGYSFEIALHELFKRRNGNDHIILVYVDGYEGAGVTSMSLSILLLLTNTFHKFIKANHWLLPEG